MTEAGTANTASAIGTWPSGCRSAVSRAAHPRIEGFEVMRMIRRGHCILQPPGAAGEVRLINELFDLAA
jgi:hypothetical protein